MSRPGWAAFAAALLLASPLAAAPLPEIRGTVYEGDPDHPVPAALVALYDPGDLLVDSTYTRGDGAFRLRTPADRGRFYVVATKGGSSRRAELDFDPAKGRGRYVTFTFPAEKKNPVLQAGGWLVKEFGAVAGLLIGYLFRLLVEERLTAKTKRDLFLSDLRALVAQALGQYPERAPETRLAEITGAVHPIRQLLDRRTDMPDVLYASGWRTKDKKGARDGFAALDARLRSVEKLLADAPPESTDTKRDYLRQAKELLERIRDRPLAHA